MKFNLLHFLAKRKLTIETWASQNGISSLEDYQIYIKNNDFADSLEVQEKLNVIFSMKKLPMEIPAIPIAEDAIPDIGILNIEEKEEKVSKKKRLKHNAD